MCGRPLFANPVIYIVSGGQIEIIKNNRNIINIYYFYKNVSIIRIYYNKYSHQVVTYFLIFVFTKNLAMLLTETSYQKSICIACVKMFMD